MKRRIPIQLLLTCLLLSACDKDKFLTELPDSSFNTPRSLSQLQLLLDNDAVFNGNNPEIGVLPSLLVSGTDEITVTDLNRRFLTPIDISQYTWAKDPFGNGPTAEWNFPYRAILYTNSILEGLEDLPVSDREQTAYKTLRGGALFHRAFMNYALAQIFAVPYSSFTAATDWGIPLKFSVDINETLQRATVQETYSSILQDLHAAETLLPDTVRYKTRPSRAAVLALLARVYQTVGNMESALSYASQCLLINNRLINYNELINSASGFSFEWSNPEVLFASRLTHSILHNEVNAAWVTRYKDNDLRKKFFFYETKKDQFYFKGSYDGTASLFGGLATDEVYLIKAACEASLGRPDEAMDTLKPLLECRYEPGGATDLMRQQTANVLDFIMDERQRELYGRGLRWTDLRQQQIGIPVNHVYAGTTYTLHPFQSRYTWPIPPDVIRFNPALPQNTYTQTLIN